MVRRQHLASDVPGQPATCRLSCEWFRAFRNVFAVCANAGSKRILRCACCCIRGSGCHCYPVARVDGARLMRTSAQQAVYARHTRRNRCRSMHAWNLVEGASRETEASHSVVPSRRPCEANPAARNDTGKPVLPVSSSRDTSRQADAWHARIHSRFALHVACKCGDRIAAR